MLSYPAIAERGVNMFIYEIEQTGQEITIIDPEMLGRKAALQSHVIASHEIIHTYARKICEKILADMPHITNDPKTYTKKFIVKFSKAYREEVVSLRHQMCISMLNCGP